MGSGLWTTTAGGDIYELTNFDMNSKSNQINDIIVVNNELFIEANLANSIGVSLWQSEGVIDDEVLILDFNRIIKAIFIHWRYYYFLWL